MNFVELNDVADITMGTSPKGNTLSNDPKDGIEFHQGKTNFTSMKLAPSKIYTTNSIKEAKPGSIVMSVRAPVGDCNITDREVSIGRGLCAIVGKENILTKFIYYYLVNNSGLIQSKATGSTFKAISTEDVKSIIIPLPPLPVQEEIVRILDAFTELESELESELKSELAARKKQYEYYRDYLLTFGDKEREREREREREQHG